MEIAGVVLGAVPIILYTLENYQRAWGPVKGIRDWGETIETMKLQIFLQKQQLHATLGVLDLEATDNITMAEIEAALQISHPNKHTEFMEIIRQMDTLMNEMAKDLVPDAQGPPTWEDVRSDRMKWEWRRVKRSFGGTRRKEVFRGLQHCNTALQNSGLEKRETLPETENRIVNLIRKRFDEDRTVTLRQNAGALHKAMASSFGCHCSRPHEGNIQLNWHENRSFDAPPTVPTPQKSSNSTTPPPIASPSTPINLCAILQTSNDYQSLLKSIPVPDSDPCKQLRIISMDRKNSSSPANTKRTVKLHALLSRVVDQTTNRKLVLNRKQRFGIASALAWAVLHLCDSPWLEESLNNEEIHLFLEQEKGALVPRLSNHPYMSRSFTPLSPKPPSTSSPSSQFQSKQIQNITLYHLAIRLIELGLNKPFSKLRQEYQSSSTFTLGAPSQASLVDDYDIAKYQISELELDPGITYSHAVDRCLRFLFPGSPTMNTFEHRSFRRTFFVDVVAPIQATYELIPGSCSQV
ncbi:hypothetical protein CC80DRAFT_596261 [Byssothecium circinans]|uniref:DUF7580 domain-containing protein n=1 Tax=Byssothecium circinans TaxID=147558 RepID=A0A6A5TJ15_9PLEO|nr:hypothetical protein CC80DRAFT_596261 [Byssothecium circinans]